MKPPPLTFVRLSGERQKKRIVYPGSKPIFQLRKRVAGSLHARGVGVSSLKDGGPSSPQMPPKRGDGWETVLVPQRGRAQEGQGRV